MYKEGEKVNLNGKDYIISKCSFASGYKACMFCQMTNIKPPCVECFDYPDTNITFGLRECKENMPEGCIPKRA